MYREIKLTKSTKLVFYLHKQSFFAGDFSIMLIPTAVVTGGNIEITPEHDDNLAENEIVRWFVAGISFLFLIWDLDISVENYTKKTIYKK